MPKRDKGKEIRDGLVPLPFMENKVDLMKRYFTEDTYYPHTDITQWPPERLREAHAYWSGNWVYLINALSQIRTEIRGLRRTRERRYHSLYIRYKGEGKTNDIARYRAEGHKVMIKLDDEIDTQQSMIEITEGLLESCDRFRQLCSRDQSYREKEIDMYGKKTGQGR